MARCGECNRFVSEEKVFDSWDVEGSFEKAKNDEKLLVCYAEITARVVSQCSECGTDLKEANFVEGVSIEIPIEHAGEAFGGSPGHELEDPTSDEPEVCERKERGRWQIGFEAEVSVKCSCGVEWKGGVQSFYGVSEMEEV